MKIPPGTVARNTPARLPILALSVAVLALVLAGGAAAFVRSGWYDISANTQHLQPVYGLLQTAMHFSVKRRAAGIEPPVMDDARRKTGAAVYLVNCVQCHGAPGMAPEAFANALQPLPGPLVDARKRWQLQDLYWITRNGVKMSGMPAWEYRLSDEDLWAVVAFLEVLPVLSVPQFAALAADLEPTVVARERTDAVAPPQAEVAGADGVVPDPARGLIALHQHGCNSCHVIPGVTGSNVHVGPPLKGIASRKLIAGSVPNEPQQMVRWLRDPKSIDRWTAMPAMGVSEAAARDMAAYLATLR